MNEQLVVKNFGPIKDATVDFKRVTVFIGPTGGGKSTLAKLAAIFRNGALNTFGLKKRKKFFDDFSLEKSFNDATRFTWRYDDKQFTLLSDLNFDNGKSTKPSGNISPTTESQSSTKITLSQENIRNSVEELLKNLYGPSDASNDLDSIQNALNNSISKLLTEGVITTTYFTSNRVFIPSVEYSWAGLLRDDIGLPKDILDFANAFSVSRKDVHELDIPFLNVKYLHSDGKDFIKIPESETLFRLYETASGIQSVTPLLVLLEHLSRNTEQAQSFIIEEPELNLYPTAQRDLVYTLLEKCTQGENDLTITTHSPYVLSALNLALYANKVATLFPYQHKKVAKLIPEKYWLKAEEFSAYFVAKGGATSIFDSKTGLLSESQLDEVSGEFADVFDRLTDLRVPEKKAVAKVKPVKK
ncbi:AAA family ATPase [Hymenobacter siberiensis]|uniref:AAA family ATPase n=1 Tax=Hymenobacter siberiensis TaxID=2848396 RepID=UPI001C1DF720|nr:AAA family ATPase [Hymenobacter siberiensis]